SETKDRIGYTRVSRPAGGRTESSRRIEAAVRRRKLGADAAVGNRARRSILRGVHIHSGSGQAFGVRKTVDKGSIMQGVIVRIALGVFGLLTVAMLLLAVFNDKGALQVRAQANKLTTIENEISNLDAENKQLNADIQALRNDPTTIEKFAREELKLVKPGEIV